MIDSELKQCLLMPNVELFPPWRGLRAAEPWKVADDMAVEWREQDYGSGFLDQWPMSPPLFYLLLTLFDR